MEKNIEPTILEKNISIAGMLGYSNPIIDKDFYFVEKFNYKEDFVIPKLLELNFEKRFYSDANWQFEAILAVEKLGYIVESHEDSCLIQSNDGDYSESCNCMLGCSYDEVGQGKNRKEAIFEALYQFSVYFKNKKQ